MNDNAIWKTLAAKKPLSVTTEKPAGAIWLLPWGILEAILKVHGAILGVSGATWMSCAISWDEKAAASRAQDWHRVVHHFGAQEGDISGGTRGHDLEPGGMLASEARATTGKGGVKGRGDGDEPTRLRLPRSSRRTW